jgi:hypothetical protein
MGVMKMYEKLRKRLDELFENAPKNRRANDLKEELLANLIDKYNDLIKSGKSEDEAINIVISGIGDVDDLIKGLKDQDVFNYERAQKERQKSALILSISIGMYIMSVVILILCSEIFEINDNISVCLMLTLDAIATCLIVYHYASRPKYIKANDTMVEEFKEWKSSNNQKSTVLRSVRSIVWMLTTIVYFIVSFSFDNWYISWIIFLIGAAVERAITLVFQLKE